MIGYHCSHEQFSPGELLKYAQMAESAGFDCALSSDHFHPWSDIQGQSGFAWSFLGAALQATTLPFGVVNAPGYRYHPAIIAQASATLEEMFPGRFFLAIGSGQLMNEGITGGKWPPHKIRNERLHEAATVIRDLWSGRTVSFYGHVSVEQAVLYTRPKKPPLLIAAAISPQTAEWAGGWADGLITISRQREVMKKVFDSFRKGGGEGKPVFLKVQLSYSDKMENAVNGAWEQWRTVMLANTVQTELRTPSQFIDAAEFVTKDDMKSSVRISSDLSYFIDQLSEDLEMGFERLFLHNVNTGQKKFIEDFGGKVLPALR
jgi:probable non-F420 flavinoid oxidoreductase